MSWRRFRELLELYNAFCAYGYGDPYVCLQLAELAANYIPWHYPGDFILSVHDNLRTLSIKSIIAYLKRVAYRIVQYFFPVTYQYQVVQQVVTAPPPRESGLDPLALLLDSIREFNRVTAITLPRVVPVVLDRFQRNIVFSTHGVNEEANAWVTCYEHQDSACIVDGTVTPAVELEYAEGGAELSVTTNVPAVGGALVIALKAEVIPDPSLEISLADHLIGIGLISHYLANGSNVVWFDDVRYPSRAGTQPYTTICSVDPYNWFALGLVFYFDPNTYAAASLTCFGPDGSVLGTGYVKVTFDQLNNPPPQARWVGTRARPGVPSLLWIGSGRFRVDFVVFGLDSTAVMGGAMARAPGAL